MMDKISSFLKDHLFGMLIFSVIAGLLTAFIINMFGLIPEKRSVDLKVLQEALKIKHTKKVALFASSSFQNADEPLIEAIIEHLTADSVDIQAEATFALAKIRPKHPKLVKSLGRLLIDEKNFEQIWLSENEFLEELSFRRRDKLISVENVKNKYRVFQLPDLISGLDNYADKLIPQLSNLLNHDRTVVRINAAKSLLGINKNNQKARDVIRESAILLAKQKHSNKRMLAYSIDILAETKIAHSTLVPQLLHYLISPPNSYFSGDAAILVQSFLKLDTNAEHLSQSIEDLIMSVPDNIYFIENYIKELGYLMVPNLTNILKRNYDGFSIDSYNDRHPVNRALEYIMAIGPDATSAAPTILKLLEDEFKAGRYNSNRVYKSLTALAAIKPDASKSLRIVFNLLRKTSSKYFKPPLVAILNMKNFHTAYPNELKKYLSDLLNKTPVTRKDFRLLVSMALLKVHGYIRLNDKPTLHKALDIYKQFLFSDEESYYQRYRRLFYKIDDPNLDILLGLKHLGIGITAKILSDKDYECKYGECVLALNVLT